MERAPNIVSLSGSFILENLAGILMVTLILILFRFYFTANNIKIEKQKTKLKKVLLIDSDPQGNASTGLGISETERSPSLYELLTLGEFDKKSIKKNINSKPRHNTLNS